MIPAGEPRENGGAAPTGRRLAAGLVLVFAASLIVFSVIQFSTPLLVSEDSYYHTRVSQIIRDRGPLREFPWMAFGVLTDRFSDKDFLFHWLRSLVGARDDVRTSKIFTVVYAALIFSAVYFALARHGVPFPGYWLLLLFGAGYFFLIRLTFFRPHLLQILFFILALEFLIARRHTWLFVLSAVHALSHVTSVGVVALALLWSLVNYVPDRRWEIRGIVASGAGVALGFLVHPNFPANVGIWYVQIVQTLTHVLRLGGARDLNQGSEFWPVDGRMLVTETLLPTLLLLVALAVAIHERPRWRRESVFLWIVALAGFSGFLLSRRLIELWAPAQVLAAGFLMRDWIGRQREHPVWSRTRRERVVIVTAVIAVTLFHDAALVVKMRKETIRASRSSFGARFAGVGQWIDEHVPANEILYNANWGSFVYLFYYAPRHRYVVGLDPIFLYAKDQELWALYNTIMAGNDPEGVTHIQERFQSRWAVVEWELRNLSNQLQRDPRVALRFQGDGVSLYEIFARSSFDELKRQADRAMALDDPEEAVRLYALLRQKDPGRFDAEMPKSTVALAGERARSQKPLRLLGREERFEGWVLERGRYRAGTAPEFVVEERMDDGGRIGKELSVYTSAPEAAGKYQFRLTSPPFTIPGSRMTFIVRGGVDLSLLRVSLVVDGREVLWTSGPGSLDPSPRLWDLSGWRGKTAVLVLVDYLSTAGSILIVENVRFSD